MVYPLAQLAVLRAQRVRLAACLQPDRIVLHLEKPLGAGQLRGCLREGRRADAGAFDRRVQITEQPVHVFAGQIPRRMRFRVHGAVARSPAQDDGSALGIFQHRLQHGLLASLANTAGIVRSDRPVVDGPLAL
ncbi:hypothetical protein FVF58_45870 [Paraburkholderia panacisoli]|uniref:Uncharacterized protein n=1 Tax=Paraburkholderia panacisoli TaxID=2603818 RepID=A0A5B0G7V2_9BURK|nr:hypothetical protein [Paraburkholderia panacisoli]KAA0998120.1 hypothetical protein FVF58_45870 [Paraburkholderia panacisoli]